MNGTGPAVSAGGRARLSRWLLAAALLLPLALPMPARAHDIGETQLTLDVHDDRSFVLDILTDPDALLARLLGSDPSAALALDPASRDARLASLGAAVLASAHVSADGVALPSTYEYRAPALDATAAGLATLRLRGTLPPAARTLQVRYGWSAGTVPVTLQRTAGGPRTVWVEPGAVSEPLPIESRRPPLWRTAIEYLGLGFTHILPHGTDHILFVVGLCLLRLKARTIVTQVSAFTAAHSLTLGLTLFGVVALPSRLVESLIALSIVYVALENLMTRELRHSRTMLVFGFGLLHGMGFASVLREVGLPRVDVLPALIGFNVGVECGQLAVVAGVVLLVRAWALSPERQLRLVTQPASAAIAVTGLYWTAQRLL